MLARPGTGPATVALVTHLDTVFPPEEEARNDFRWQPEGDRIYGPGTHDIKGGTAMILLVLEALRELAPDVFAATTWKLLANASEETLSEHFGEVCRARLAPDTRAILVFEAEGTGPVVGPGGASSREPRPPTPARRLVRSRKGRATWRLRVEGRGGHAGNQHRRGVNAVVQLARLVDRAAALTDHARDLTVNPAFIRGGGGLNRVPHEAEAGGELRAFDPAVYAQACGDLRALAGPGDVRAVSDGQPAQVTVEILSESRPWPRNDGTDRLLALWQQAGADLGERIEGEDRGGLSDGNLLWDLAPTLDGLGPAGDNDHCSERSADGSKLPEHVDVTSFVPKAAVNVLALARLLG